MYRFEFVSTVGEDVSADSGIHEIETSRGLIRIDVEEDGLLITFSIKRKKSIYYTQLETEIDLLKANGLPEQAIVASVTVEEKCIISEDEVLIILTVWPIYAMVTALDFSDGINQN